MRRAGRRRVRAHLAPGCQHDAGPRRSRARATARTRGAPRLRRRQGAGCARKADRAPGAHPATGPRRLRPAARGRRIMTDFTTDMATRMRELLTRFRLPTVAAEVVRRLDDAGHHDALPTLLEVFEAEADERAQRRTERLLKMSRLPAGKTLETLERARLPRPVIAKLDELSTGEFLDRADNVLCFGLPGRGKPHGAAALGHALVQRGHSVFFSPTFRLVQELLAAQRDLTL